MLRLMDIQRIHERERGTHRIYQVTLERDGVCTRYDFTWEPPSRPDALSFVYEPDEVVHDLIDYDLPARPGEPCGALLIPPLQDIIQYVFKTVRGKTLDFPIVLDER